MSSSTLSQYFPFFDQPSTTETQSGTYAVASVGIAMLKMLETLLPAAAKEVEHESHSMVGHFQVIAQHLSGQKLPSEVSHAIGGMIMSMQFQDRNTQVMDTVASMLERFRIMLEEICTDIEAMRDNDAATPQNVAYAVNHILDTIRLSDIRQRYIEAMVKANVQTTELAETANSNKALDIELF